MAILTAADLVTGLSNDLLPYLDKGGAAKPAESLLGQLLLKGGSNDKRFVIDEVDRALSRITQHMRAEALIEMLLPYASHKGPKVRHDTSSPFILMYTHQNKIVYVVSKAWVRKVRMGETGARA